MDIFQIDVSWKEPKLFKIWLRSRVLGTILFEKIYLTMSNREYVKPGIGFVPKNMPQVKSTNLLIFSRRARPFEFVDLLQKTNLRSTGSEEHSLGNKKSIQQLENKLAQFQGSLLNSQINYDCDVYVTFWRGPAPRLFLLSVNLM